MSTCRTHTGVCGVLCVSRVSSGFDRVRSLCERWHKLHSLERALRGQDRNACPCPGMTRKRFSSAPLSPFSSLFPPLSGFLFCQIIVMPLAAGPRRPSTDWRFYRAKRVAAGRRADGQEDESGPSLLPGEFERERAQRHTQFNLIGNVALTFWRANWGRTPLGPAFIMHLTFLQPPLRPNPSPLPSLLCPQLSLCIL